MKSGRGSLSLCGLCWVYLKRVCRSFFCRQPDFRIRAGVLCLLLNVPVGYLGLAICSFLALATGHRAFWGGVGTGCYALSWGMLGVGCLLVGVRRKPILAKIKRQWRACRRLRKR